MLIGKNTTHDLINAGFELLETEDTVELESERLWDLHHADELNRFFNENGIHTTELKQFFIEKK